MKYILLGDLHFGVKKFSLEFFENQMKFFENQLFPYMKEHNIYNIIQTGDLFDNRIVMDINFISLIRKRFFDVLVKNNIILTTYIGNHDMYYKNTRTTNSIKLFVELYPNNIILFENQELLTINNKTVGIVPFLVPSEPIDSKILKNSEYIFGHFETQGFEIAKGVTDTHSELTASSFSKYPNIKGVFSGHYHIKNTEGFVKYVGIPYNTSLNDYGNKCGFHILDEDFNIEFIENTQSLTYVKMIYTDTSTNTLNIDGCIVHTKDVIDFLNTHKNIIIKFYIYGSLDNTTTQSIQYTKYLDILKQYNVNYSIIDKREENNIADNTKDIKHKDKISLSSTDSFINDYIKTNHEELYTLFLELISIKDSTI
jgi:DNA repair exonuclease SbcCD nuclease subunit